MEITPTIVPASFDDVLSGAERYAFAGMVHIDAAGGRFVPNTTWLPAEGDTLPQSVRWDAHLMTESPADIGVRFARAGAVRISAHIEAFKEESAIPEALRAWKADGAQETGIAVRIDTPLERLSAAAAFADFLLIMTIASIGAQGSPFDARATERIQALHARFPELLIAVDGGINETNITDMSRAGARRFCVGSALASSAEPEAVYKRLAEAAGAIQ